MSSSRFGGSTWTGACSRGGGPSVTAFAGVGLGQSM
jgi:hypothetical protein